MKFQCVTDVNLETRLPRLKKASVNTFTAEGKSPLVLVNIREYYQTQDLKELPSAKGIALTKAQWEELKSRVS